MKQEQISNIKLLTLGGIVFILFTPIFFMLINGDIANYIKKTTPLHENTVQEATDRYMRKHVDVLSWAIIERQLNYYWYEPDEFEYIDSELPLVVILHGSTGYSYAGKYLIKPDILSEFPAFIMIPMTPWRSMWSHPTLTSNVNELPYVVKAINLLIEQYPIDKNRIYIIGCSMGGHGVFGASTYFDNVFAAGVSISGNWKLSLAPQMTKMPLLIMAGSHDTVVPEKKTYSIYKALYDLDVPVEYIEHDMGHNCPSPLLYTWDTWDWLFDQEMR